MSKIHIPRIILLFIICDVLIVAAYLLAQSFDLSNDWLMDFLDIDNENNLPAWYSSVKLLVIGLLLLVYTLSGENRSGKYRLRFLLPMIFILLSLDEIAMLHESLGTFSDFLLPRGTRRGTAFRVTGIWMFVLGVPFIGLMTWLVMDFYRQINESEVIRKLVAGLVIFLTAALFIEIFSNYYRRGIGYLVQVSLEEFGEMIGATIILWAVYDLLKIKKIVWDFSKPR